MLLGGQVPRLQSSCAPRASLLRTVHEEEDRQETSAAGATTRFAHDPGCMTTTNYLKSFIPGESKTDRYFFFDDRTSLGIAGAVAHAVAESRDGRQVAVFRSVPVSDLRIVPEVGSQCPFFTLAEYNGFDVLQTQKPNDLTRRPVTFVDDDELEDEVGELERLAPSEEVEIDA